MPEIITDHTSARSRKKINEWVAYYKGQEERLEYGYGPTRQQAIEDLKSLHIEENESWRNRLINSWFIKWIAKLFI